MEATKKVSRARRKLRVVTRRILRRVTRMAMETRMPRALGKAETCGGGEDAVSKSAMKDILAAMDAAEGKAEGDNGDGCKTWTGRY